MSVSEEWLYCCSDDLVDDSELSDEDGNEEEKKMRERDPPLSIVGGKLELARAKMKQARHNHHDGTGKCLSTILLW